MLDEIRQQVTVWLNDFLRRDLLPEVIGLLFIVVLGLILARILKVILNRIDKAIGKGSAFTYAPSLRYVLDLTRLVLLPVSIWLVGKGVTRIFQLLEQPHGIIDYILAYRINLGKGLVVTGGALMGALVVVCIFVLLGRYVRGLQRDVILPRMDASNLVVALGATILIVATNTLGVNIGGLSFLLLTFALPPKFDF